MAQYFYLINDGYQFLILDTGDLHPYKVWKAVVYIIYIFAKLKGKKKNPLLLEEGTDWFKIGKGTHQGCILSPCLFNLYAEYIMRNARLDEAQAGIQDSKHKIARKNINNLRYADDTTLMAESEEELKSLLMKVKEESEKVDLKLNIQ